MEVKSHRNVAVFHLAREGRIYFFLPVVRRILETAGTILGSGKYESEAVVRVLVAVGTVLLVPGCEDEAKAAANGMGVSSMVERIGGAHGDRAGAVAGEIRSILTR